MHSVPQPGLTVLAVAGQLEREVRHHRTAETLALDQRSLAPGLG